jgi:hypothetical protein
LNLECIISLFFFFFVVVLLPTNWLLARIDINKRWRLFLSKSNRRSRGKRRRGRIKMRDGWERLWMIDGVMGIVKELQI